LYKAFNDRDVGTLMDAMHPDVDWPNFLEGGRVRGRDALRQYWSEQFAMVQPEASPIEMLEVSGDRIVVRLHYLIKAMEGGGVWTDEITSNTFTFADDLVLSMDWGEPEDGAVGEPDALLINLFDAYNAKDVEAAGALLHPDVDWPNVMGTDRLHGREAVREMWAQQFLEFDARISLIEMTTLPDGRRKARVSYEIRDLTGKLFTEEPATHTFAFRDGLISWMELERA
jgi:ketosteroid isomerase-like protein